MGTFHSFPCMLASMLSALMLDLTVAMQQSLAIVDTLDDTSDMPESDSLQKENNGKKYQRLLYDHMPKTGGTFLVSLFRSAVGKKNFVFRSEFSNLTRKNVSDNFVVGSVRNPCDYYVSLWAYGAEHGGSMMSHIPKEERYLYETESSHKDSTKDKAMFQAWVRMINKKGQPGVMSVRFARSYSRVNPGIVAAAPPMRLEKKQLDNVKKALEGADFMQRVDCWVRTETVQADAKACLQAWQQNTGNRINWRRYRDVLRHGNQLQSSHAHCKDYFTPELEARVREHEAIIFDHFGYDTCCA